MNNKVAVAITVILLLIAVGLGAAIYQRQSQPTVNTPASPVSPTTPNPTNPTGSNDMVNVLFAANPGPNATTDQLKTYSGRVFQASTESSSLDVTGCSPTPAILHMGVGKSLAIKNTDSVSHKLVNGTLINLDVAAKSDKSIDLNLQPGIYVYSCDTKIAGIIQVTQ